MQKIYGYVDEFRISEDSIERYATPELLKILNGKSLVLTVSLQHFL